MPGSNRFWNGSKKAAYNGLLLALIGGIGIGMGIVFSARAESYIMFHVVGLVLVFLGILAAILGFLSLRRSRKSTAPPPPH